MNIKADQEYAGLPLLAIRKLLKAASHNFGWDSAFATPILQIDEPAATHVIRKLVADGYIERASNVPRNSTAAGETRRKAMLWRTLARQQRCIAPLPRRE